METLPLGRRRTRAALVAPALVGVLLCGALLGVAMGEGQRAARAAAPAEGVAAAGSPRANSSAVAPGVARALAAAGSQPSGQSGPLTASVDVSPFYPNGDGVRDRTSLSVTLDQPATLSISVLNFDGATMRKLAVAVSAPAGQSTWTWDGRGPKKKLAPDGAYLFRATAKTASGTFSVDRWVAKDRFIPYAAAPGALVIAVDSGHGGPDSGAYYGRIREATMNMDIGLRLQHMLEASGVRVVMTRTLDVAVNSPAVDVSGDGKITQQDELISRNDIANLARADLRVVLMNNAYGCRCAQGTESYTSGERSWTPEGVDLARLVQAAHMARLRPFRTSAWQPRDRGVKLWDFAAIRPYKKWVMPRPSLMPVVLTESLFMDHPNELAVLNTPAVRAALAAAYYDGIVQWLAKRAYGLRYDVLSAPESLEVGTPADYTMRLTNRGNQSSSGWILEARMVAAVPGQPYDGSPVRGTLVAQTTIPDGLAPGQSVEIALPGVPTPTVGGRWQVKFDVRLPGNAGTLQDHGVVGPQLALTTTEPAPLPSPSPSPQESVPPSGPPQESVPPGATPSELPSSGPSLPGESPPPAASPAESPAASLGAGTVSPDPSPLGGSAPVEAVAVDVSGIESVAVPARLFGRALPFDPLAGRPGAARTVHWGLREPWRRSITPMDPRRQLPGPDLDGTGIPRGTAPAASGTG